VARAHLYSTTDSVVSTVDTIVTGFSVALGVKNNNSWAKSAAIHYWACDS